MAIINNHSKINLDAGFQGDHSELLQFFFNQGLNVEITDNATELKTFLESYYEMDGRINELHNIIDNDEGVILDEVINISRFERCELVTREKK